MSLPRFSVNNPILVNLLAIIIVVWGGTRALKMVREMFPESRPNKLLITTVHPGVAPEEIEKAITIKIEEAVRDVDGIEKINSVVREGSSTTILTLYNYVKDADQMMQEIKAEIDAIDDLPDEAEKTTVKKLEPKLPVISVALFGPGTDADRKRAARALRDDLLLLPGVSEVEMSGQRLDEISVEIRPEKLVEYDITFDEVAQAIRETNLDVTGGQLEGDRSLISVRTLGEEQRGVDLNKLLVRSLSDGRNIHLSDVAHVTDGFVDTEVEGFYNGQPLINCTLYKTASQDVIRISSLVKAYVYGKQGKAFDPHGFDAAAADPWYWRPFSVTYAYAAYWLKRVAGYPDPMVYYERSRANPFQHNFQVDLHTDLARFVEGRIDLMFGNGMQGLYLVLLALIVFLNWRVAFWTAAGIPVTFLGGFILMSMFGVTLNLISLMGMIIVLSIDVDEAVVMGENVFRYIEEGLSPKEAAIKGSEEVLWPVFIMTGTTIGAFFPLLFIEGQLGDFMKMLPLVCISSMLMSMLEALVILPSHLGHLKAIRPATSQAGEWGLIRRGLLRLSLVREWFMHQLINVWYDRFIRLSLRWRYVTLTAALASLSIALGMWYGGVVPTTWVQKMDSETLVCNLEMPIGTPVTQTKERLNDISAAAVKLPEVVNVQMLAALQVDIAGEGAVGFTQASHVGQLIIELKESYLRTKSSEVILGELREVSEKLPGVNSVTWISLNGGPAGRSIEIKLSTERFDDSLAAAQTVKARLASFRGVFDIDDNADSGLREVRLKVREAARPTGVTVAGLGNEVRSALYGREARRITRNREDVKIMVRYPEHYRRDIYRVEDMWIPVAADGGRNWVPLREVAELTESQASNTIHRSQQQRSVSIFADVDEAVGNESEIVAAVQKWLDSDFQREHPGVRAEMLGKTVEINKFTASMAFAFPMSLVIIYVLLAALFKSYVQPLVVMIAVPFGVQGAVIGHWIMGYDLTIMSMIGLVALNGIVDNDSLVLVDFINNRQRAGLSLYEASVEGSKLRLRAILLTTVTVVAGMAPLMAEQSFQAKFLIPLAITLSFGLIFATLLTLVVVPSINMVFFDMKRAWHWLLLGEADATGEEAELVQEPATMA
jgi:multidrug efflux pump subunit AcrB